jgi:lysophospholipase L1-like esterase
MASGKYLKKEILCYLIIFLLVAGFCCFAWVLADRFLTAKGKDLNQAAWNATYLERGLAIPPSGPREGYWGTRLGQKTPDELLGWHDSALEIPGLVSIDSHGIQYYKSPGEVRFRILMLGASVAFGALASDISTTYFNVIGRMLEAEGYPVKIVVFASGGWKSIQELNALQKRPDGEKPDLILFLNGLNDITNGASANHLTGQGFNGPDHKLINPSFRVHDYNQRVSGYLKNMSAAATFAANSGIRMLVALQPSLAERSHRTPLEEKLLVASLQRHASLDAIRGSYAEMRKGLQQRERANQLDFIDCSALFDNERETTFTDMWHFSDIGHRLLGQAIAGKITGMLVSIQQNKLGVKAQERRK